MSDSEISIVQKSIYHGSLSLKVEDDHVRCHVSRFFASREDRVPLNIFNPDPIKYRSPNYKSLIGVAACGFFIWLSLIDPNKWASMFITVPMSLFGIFGVGYFLDSLNERLSFFNRFNGSSIVNLRTNKPTKEKYEMFLAAFQDKVRTAVKLEETSASQSIASELERISVLHEKKVLTDAEFDKLKRDLIEGKNIRKMGF